MSDRVTAMGADLAPGPKLSDGSARVVGHSQS